MAAKHPKSEGRKHRAKQPAVLDKRAQDVLLDVVQQFVREGRPVGSRVLSRRGSQPLSPATLRNVMSDLEEAEFLYQPHASAGRVPTDKGYRFFVNCLLEKASAAPAPPPENAFSPEERRRLLEGLRGIDELFSRASRLLAEKTRQVGLVMPPAMRDAQIQHLEFLPVAGGKMLAILVTRSGLVQNKLLTPPRSCRPEELAVMNRMLQERCTGLTLAQIRERLVQWMAEDRARYDELLRRALELGKLCFNGGESQDGPAGELHVEGAARLLEAQGFMGAQELHRLFEAFESKHQLVELLTACLEEDGLTVLIGSEIPGEQITHCSLVLSSYETPGGGQGVLGVVGPTRMHYQRAIRAVGAAARLVKEAMEEKE